MAKNLTQVSADTVVMIDKSILDLLKTVPEAKVSIKTDGKKIVIEAIYDGDKIIISDDEKTQKLYEYVVEKHKKMLKKLAE